MAEPRIVNTLSDKITDVERYIAEMEKRLENARHDLAHLQATLRLFRRGDDTAPVYMGLTRIFRRGGKSQGYCWRPYGLLTCLWTPAS